jgi:NADPH2:quinone reductase
MKAVLCKEYGLPGSLVLEEVPSPKPATGQVVVSVKACGVNFPDTLIIQGKYQFKPEMPFSPGGEVAGVVKEVGESVTRVKPGDRVIAFNTWGGFAEEMVVDADRTIPMPATMEFVPASAFVLTYGTSYHALKDRADIKAGETLLVLGAAGGVGLAAIQLGKGIDVVYDPVGGPYSELALRDMAWKGRFLVVGFAAGDIPKVPLNLTLLKGCSIVGVFWGSFTKNEPERNRENNWELMAMYAAGKIKPHIHAVYPLEKAAEALNEVLNKRVTGKVVLTT